MARIQILELPTEHHGDDMITPFVVIIDQVQNVEALRETLGESDIREALGARAVLAFDETVEIPANEAGNGSSYEFAVDTQVVPERGGPDFTSPLTNIEVRQPCPYCGDRQMIPRHQFAEHIARLHPDATRQCLT